MAVRPDAGAVAHADAALLPVRAGHADLRWVPPQRWHLTLAFYGEIADDKVPGVVDTVGRAVASAGAVRLSLHGSGLFARRALWLGVTGEVDRLRRLARSVTSERRPYRPHLTVARLRGNVDGTAARDALADYAGPQWVADEVHLVRSRLGPQPSYDDVATWRLAHTARCDE